MALEVFVLIQISFGFCTSLMYASKISLFSIGFCVQFSPSSSGSLVVVTFGSMAIHANILACRRGRGFPWCFLKCWASPG